jgi:Zn-dependent metalloprotease
VIRLRVRVGLSVLLAMVVAGGQSVTTFGAPSSVPSPTHDKSRRIKAEQADAASAARAVGLGAGEALVVKDVIPDRDGTTNVRYDRTYEGLRVIGGDLVSHRDISGAIESVSRNTSHTVAVPSTTPRISLASAEAAGARKASEVQERTSATQDELVVYAGGTSRRATPKLAYDVLSRGVRADKTPSRLHTIVDASTGATLVSWDEIESGTGDGIHVGTVSIDTTAGPPWSMRDTAGDNTSDLSGSVAGPGVTFTNTSDSWGNGTNTDRASAGVDAHYGAEKTLDYFKNVLGRNGIWDTGVGAHSRVHFGDNVVNAFWDGSQMTYGDGAGNTHPLVELDVAGHEMTHGVTQNTAGLLYTGESGGLNEATSDIFGTAVEWHANNAADTPDYTIGELIDFNGNGTPLRYLDRPSRDGVSPDCWSSKVGSLDPHSASGPLNHWFYLASEGSGAKVVNGVSYDSPTCNASTVTPIGQDKAAKIWYRTLSVYLTSNSTYATAREGAIQSAKDLYGAKSSECAGIAASFSAIGVPAGALSCGVTPPPVGGNLLSNPGFESGAVSWTGDDGPISNNTGRPPHSGSWKMWLGGNGTTATESEWQSATIPAGAVAPKLSFWIRTDTAEQGNTAADTLKVQAISGAATSTLATYSNVGASSTYSQATFDLSAFTGKTIAIRFLMNEDAAQQTSFVIDDTAVTTSNNTATTAIFSPLDFTGDAKSDVMKVTSNGDLYLYRGDGAGGFTGAGTKIGAGWGGFVKVFSPGDFSGDGIPDILAIKGNGEMYLYRGNGLGGFSGSGTRIGRGWGVFVKLLSAGDFNGDGKSDVLGIKSNGQLYLYRGNGLGGFAGIGTKIGAGWSVFGEVFSPGDFTGDGRSDLLAVKLNGDLLVYRGDGRGGFAGIGTKIGAGWSVFGKVFSPGDFTGDGRSDLLAVKEDGDLYLYRGNGLGGFTGSGSKIVSA